MRRLRFPSVLLSRALLLAVLVPVPAGSVEIWEIQGAGSASPLVGQVVTTSSNLVAAVGRSGFFIRTPPDRSDGDPATSDGLFVYTGGDPGVQVGDLVDVTGTVTEYHGMTEIAGSPTVSVISRGNTVPPPVDLDATDPSPTDPPPENVLERYEGMEVRILSGTVTGPADEAGIFSVVARRGRAFREPGIPWPGVEGLPVWDGNPEILEVDPFGLGVPPAHPPLGPAAGRHVNLLRGPLVYTWGRYRIWASRLEVEGGTDPPLAPVRPRRPGEITVATQNLWRLVDEDDDPATWDDPPVSLSLDQRLAKASAWIREALGAPEILAVQEVENLAVLQALADRISADEAGIRYTAWLLEGNDPGGIDVGFLTRESFPVDSLVQMGADELFSFEGRDFTLWDRPPLLLRGRYTGNGEPFPLALLAVHLRSMNGIDGDDAAFVREKRHRQAVWLSEAVQQLQEADPDVRLIVLGDFNAFQFTDGWVDVMGQVTGSPDPLGALVPASDLVEPDLANRVLLAGEEQRYSYIHEGSAQVLDHVLTSAALEAWVRGADFARGNADAPVGYAEVTGVPVRCSDHDGLVVYLMTDADGDGVPDDREGPTVRRPRERLLPPGAPAGAPETVLPGRAPEAGGVPSLPGTASSG